MKVDCVVKRTDLENERGTTTPGVIVECTKCGETVEIFGQEEGSIRRGLAMLRENCPMGEKNWYEVGSEEEE